jgi:hypothetical protein
LICRDAPCLIFQIFASGRARQCDSLGGRAGTLNRNCDVLAPQRHFLAESRLHRSLNIRVSFSVGVLILI